MKRCCILLSALVAFGVCTSLVCMAQPVLNSCCRGHYMGLRFGWESGFYLAADYGYRLAAPRWVPETLGNETVPWTDLQAEVLLPLSLFSGQGNARLGALATGTLWGAGAFQLLSRAGLAWVWGQAPTAHTQSLQWQGGLIPAYQNGHWLVGAKLGWQQAILSHFRFSPGLRDAFADRYPETRGTGPESPPADGWVWWAATGFETGLVANYAFRSWQTGLEANWLTVPNRLGLSSVPTAGWLPFTCQAHVGYWLPGR